MNAAKGRSLLQFDLLRFSEIRVQIKRLSRLSWLLLWALFWMHSNAIWFLQSDFLKNSRRRRLSLCWSILDFWKINLEKSSLKNWIFSLFRTGFLLPVQHAKISFEIDFCRLRIKFVELDFYNLIFQKSSEDQKGVWSLCHVFNIMIQNT